MTCEVFLSTLSVGYSRSLSAVSENYCNKKKTELMSSTSFWTCPSSTRNHLRKKGAIFGTAEKEIGFARSSPDSRWIRFIIVTCGSEVRSKSHRCTFLPDLIDVGYLCFWISLEYISGFSV